MQTCAHTTKAHGAQRIYRPIGRELLRVNQEQSKLGEAYNLIEDHLDITDLEYANRLFMYKDSVLDERREEARRLKDDYNQYMTDMSRPTVKLELKHKAPKHLVRRTKFIKI